MDQLRAVLKIAWNSFDFMTSPPIINGVKDADTVEIEFFRHKVLIDLSENVELLITSTTQEDMIGGRRSPSIETRYMRMILWHFCC